MSFRIPVRVLVWAIAALSLLIGPTPVAERARSSLEDCDPQAHGLAEGREQRLFGLPSAYGTRASAAPSTSSPALLDLMQGDPLPYLRRFASALKSTDPIEQAATSRALLNADERRGVVRGVLLIAAVGSVSLPALSLAGPRGSCPAISDARRPQ